MVMLNACANVEEAAFEVAKLPAAEVDYEKCKKLLAACGIDLTDTNDIRRCAGRMTEQFMLSTDGVISGDEFNRYFLTSYYDRWYPDDWLPGCSEDKPVLYMINFERMYRHEVRMIIYALAGKMSTPATYVGMREFGLMNGPRG